MQYLRNGLVVAARKRNCRLKRMKVAIFQLMMNIPMDAPTSPELIKFTSPRYSGARKSESAPKVFIKEPFTVLNSTNQKRRMTWYFRMCRKTSCTGKE